MEIEKLKNENVAAEQQVINQKGTKKGRVMTIDPNIISNEELEELLGDPNGEETSIKKPSQKVKEKVTEKVTDEVKNEVTDDLAAEKVERFMCMDKWYVGKPMPMSYEKLVELSDDPMTTEIEDKIRLLEMEYPDHGSDYDEEKKALKNQLHFGLGHAWATQGDGSRKKQNMLLNRTAMYDGDHVGKKVREILQGILTPEFIEKNGIIFAHISPSGDGFHLLFDLLPGETIAQGQDRMAKVLGMEKEKDDAVYEENRGFFIVSRKNWLYVNPDKFYFASKDEAMKAAIEGRKVMNQNLDGSALNNENKEDNENSSTPYNNARTREDVNADLTYDGVQYAKIIDILLQKMNYTPRPNSKHEMYGTLISEMRNICNNDPELLFAILPAWKDEKERHRQCVDYCNYPYTGKPSKYLLAAIHEAKMEKTSEDNDVTGMGLPPLNKIQAIINKHVPVEQQQALAVVSNVAIGGLLSGIDCDYLDGKNHHLNFGAITVAPPSAGKAYCDESFEAILQPIQEQDDINWQIRKEYDSKARRQRKTKDMEEKPVAPLYITPFNINAPCLNMAMEEAGERHLIMFDSEVGRVVTYNNQTQGLLKSALQAAYNNEKLGQRRATLLGVNAKCKAYIQYHMAGVPEAVFEDWITDKDIKEGLASRLMLATIEDTDDMPRYEKYTEAEKKKLYSIAVELLGEKGTIYCPFLELPLQKWLEKNKSCEINKYEYGKQFYRRAPVCAWRAAVAWAVVEGIEKRSPKSQATGSKKEQDCIAYMLWLADYLLAQFTTFFLDRVKKISAQSYAKYGNVTKKSVCTYEKYGPDELLADMPDEFTTDEFKTLKKEKNYSQNDPLKMLKRFVEQGKIVKTDRKRYKKVAAIMAENENVMNDYTDDMDSLDE